MDISIELILIEQKPVLVQMMELNFWGKVVTEYTNGKYNTFTAMEGNEVGYTFSN